MDSGVYSNCYVMIGVIKVASVNDNLAVSERCCKLEAIRSWKLTVGTSDRRL